VIPAEHHEAAAAENALRRGEGGAAAADAAAAVGGTMAEVIIAIFGIVVALVDAYGLVGRHDADDGWVWIGERRWLLIRRRASERARRGRRKK
jgi:hypothetical protein